MARVRSFIDLNLHRTIHASDLSAIARRSTAHFSRSFKQAFGEPPHAYIVRRRLEEACHLMLTSSASLSETSCVGFSDQAHLSKLSGKPLARAQPTGGASETQAPLISMRGASRRAQATNRDRK